MAEIVTKGQDILSTLPLVVCQTGVHDGGARILGLPRFSCWDEMLLCTLIFSRDVCADAVGIVGEHLDIMIMACIRGGGQGIKNIW